MKITYIEMQQLPKMAWGAIVEKDTLDVAVYHGKNVETQKTFFVEGAWDGEFIEGRFDRADFFNGSGGRMNQDQDRVEKSFMFVTSSHTLDRLHTIRLKHKLIVSNSMPFALHLAHARLNPRYMDYEKDLNSILKGLYHYKDWIPLKGHKELYLHYYCNLVVDDQLSISKEKKPKMVPFESFTHYRSLLSHTLQQFVENAKSSSRQSAYGIVTTISNGYDSAACAVLAKEVGCDTALSFDRPATYEEDCGLEIAEQLGYSSIILKDASAYLSNQNLTETEFVSTGELGSGVVYTSFEEEMANNIVIFGEEGDEFWGKDRADANEEFRFPDDVLTGVSLIEHRLRVGYIFTPIPTFGGTQWESLWKLSNTPEMEPYSVGGSYDRPIPRRIIETAGIPRESFGIEKKGVGINYRYDSFSRLKERMSENSFASYQQYYKIHRKIDKEYLQRWLRYFLDTKNVYFHVALRKVGVESNLTMPNAESETNPGAPAHLIHWGVQEMQKRYRLAFEKSVKRYLPSLRTIKTETRTDNSESRRRYQEEVAADIGRGSGE
ncbi:hypothetical protein JTF06_07960 [Desemzia sp. RIT804]|uniref:hypothetical protein n=1 Tax=Desemzia sp. RIT 804 TaxID=2810209 RepID=UPI0019513D6E|nr:hypothetical protein [Desemzia sp. RIT 804]MBM6614824.1 hypothetical protein [Desemzia sp. RIT 804]